MERRGRSSTRETPTVGAAPRRVRLEVGGIVQGVGFRPFAYRLAMEERLDGWVRNTSSGVSLELEGAPARVECFLGRLRREAPPLARIESVASRELEPTAEAGFRIRASEPERTGTPRLTPDVATCPDCAREIFDPEDRRHRYPFTNCTNCGPRFTIIEALPYDRERTSMRAFRMCPACRAEYDDPADRRFHAQPNACPACGPQLALWTTGGRELARGDDALREAVAGVSGGRIVAVKSVGGFHLFADASDEGVIRELRRRKRRTEKPFAVLVPDLASARELCRVAGPEARLLESPEGPIVLLRRRSGSARLLAKDLAPGNPYVGAMLPTNPLHHLLARDLGAPVVATSGNVSDEPLCTDEEEALERLRGIADLFLVHDRPIVRRVDDSVVRVAGTEPLLLRRARGYAPLTLPRARAGSEALAVGAHQKSVVALAVRDRIVVGQHLGDLDTLAAEAEFEASVADLTRLYDVRPRHVISDLHPDYRSTRHAEQTGLPRTMVQHHVAHVLACRLENGVDEPALGVAWDGTGLGLDGAIWGGEFFDGDSRELRRFAHLREFPLPGGEAAIREPRRVALGLLHERYGAVLPARNDLPTLQAFAPEERSRIVQAVDRGINTPRTTSMGRLFDAIASLAGLRQRVSFEGQAAMELEFAAETEQDLEPYSLPVRAGAPGAPLLLDWARLVDAVIEDVSREAPVSRVAARFHGALVEAILEVARRAGRHVVLLSGGCFQNAWLAVRTAQRLREEGFEPMGHRVLPPNDGSIAVGQLAAWLATESPHESTDDAAARGGD